MNINCPRCGKVLAVPPEKAHMTGLNARCSGCGAVFLMDVAPIADSAPAPRPGAAPAPGVAPPAPAPDAAAARSAEKPRAPVPWRRCTNHPQELSQSVCQGCGKGWCKECGKAVQNAVLCPACEGLCVSSQKREEAESHARLRAVPLFDEIETIARYPLSDPTAFVMLSIVVGIFAALAAFSGYALLFARGLVMAYAFTALMRVSGGKLEGYMPEIADLTDLVVPFRLGLAAFVASSWPLILLAFLYPDARLLGPPPEGAEPTGAGVASLLVLGYLWKLLYSPVALIVAGVSRSLLQTLNPLVGLGTILRMGPVYAQAMTIYGALALGQAILDFPLFFLPIVGGILSGFVDSYANLCIGCALGLAVFKRAPELGLD
jgi:hypothetical protein